MWDLPRPGLEPVSHALAGRFSTTAPPGKPYIFDVTSYFFLSCEGWFHVIYLPKKFSSAVTVEVEAAKINSSHWIVSPNKPSRLQSLRLMRSFLTRFSISLNTSYIHLGIMQRPQPGFGCLRLCFILFFFSVPFPFLPLYSLPSLLPSILLSFPPSVPSFLPSLLPTFTMSCFFFSQKTMINSISLHVHRFFKYFTHFKIFPWGISHKNSHLLTISSSQKGNMEMSIKIGLEFNLALHFKLKLISSYIHSPMSENWFSVKYKYGYNSTAF